MYEIIGWTGAIFFISAYFLLSIKKLKADKIPYQLMNVIGGLCLVINSYHLNDNPTLITNFVWMCIGLFAIIGIVRKAKLNSGPEA
ncbi:hypothetical protein QQ008_26310 [Fulvivirgaceae bacterium BMA10]|uniref:CBU-0592-like domain-containing protein n=1 Tax=Splendidivirga corallicola TaxID=3051826 RepID=A0ABT8KVW7_9BACT|nr:hypothetical protein [Fulvivirgaceae bacterium BMA10]